MANQFTNHWSTIEPFLRETLAPQWVDGEDKMRVAAYDMYEAIFWTAPDAFQITLRGQEGQPLYVPSGRKVCETAHRYMAPGLSIITDPLFGTAPQRNEADAFFADFARRERFFSKFSSNKLNGIMRGDWVWHIFADPDRPDGKRVSIFPIHPGLYFPEYADGDDVTQIVAVHLAEPTFDEGGNAAVNVLHYRKVSGTGGPSQITTETVQYPHNEWGQPGTDMATTPIKVLAELAVLPDPIDMIPVYHIPNVYDPEFGWGSSEMRGIERLMRGINQAITDEELALVLEGLGVYTTDAGAPLDEDTEEELPWTIAPGRVIELPDGKQFNRVTGVSSIDPYMAHLNYLHSAIESVTGENDVTSGQADVSVAESGIAIALRMQPMFARILEKELVITDVHTQMLYDLRNWFTAFEDLDFTEIRWMTRYAEKLPINKSQSFTQILQMYTAVPPLISGVECRRMLTEIGYDFTDDAVLAGQIQRDQQSSADALGLRIGNIAATAPVGGNGSGG